MLNTAIC